MRGFDSRFLDELKNKNDIVDVISRYIKLDKRGTNYWGCCPFHHEKTASFCVNSIGQFFYCFGCHKSGDVITFVREMESLDFNDAVKLLAEKVGMRLPEIKYDDEKVKELKAKKERLLDCLKDTAHYYYENLKKEQASEHLRYIYSRGFTQETITRFGMGASLDFDSLPKYLLSKGYTKTEMVESGVVGEKDGRYYDWLGGRLIIPVIDQFNNVIAFDGRRIDGGKDRKYINTKETLVFLKGKTLFNINNLKKLKNEKGLDGVILVEGHLDVVSLTQGGFPNVVASMGTAFTTDQARMIKRYSEKVFVCYDGDSAGQHATVKNLEILKAEGLDVKVMSLPDGMDPDDVITKLGKDAYSDCIISAKPLIDFKLGLLKKEYDFNTVDGKRKYVASALKVIKESASFAEQEDLLKVVRDETKLSFESLQRELASIEGEETKVKIDPVPEFDSGSGDKNDVATRFILYSYLFNKQYTEETDIESLYFDKPIHKEIAQYIIDRKKEGKAPNFSDLYETLQQEDNPEISLIAGMDTDAKRDDILHFDQEIYFNDCVKTLKVYSINKEIEMLNSRYSAETDNDVRRQIAERLSKLLAEKTKLI